MKLAYFSPLSPIRSGISTYSENHLLPYLSKLCEIEVFIDKGYSPTNDFVKKSLKVHDYEKFDKESFDVTLYNMGNNLYHEYLYNVLVKTPGIVLLHDPFITGLVWQMTVGRGFGDLYVEYMTYCLGEKGKKIAELALITQNYPSFKYPLIKKVIDSSIAIIVHSDFGKSVVLAEVPYAFVKKINMPIPIVKSPPVSKKDFKISEDTLVISTFGYAQFHKRLPESLRAFAQLLTKNPNSKFLIVGSYIDKNFKKDIENLIQELNISEKVIETGFVDDIKSYIQISDIIIQARYPTAGETSIITLEIMAMEKPVIVTNIGWFSELPNDAVIKIDINENEEEEFEKAFEKLAFDIDFRKNLSSNARKYVEKEHNPEKIAFEFYDFMSKIKNDSNKKFIKNLTYQLERIGIHHEDESYLNEFSKKLHDILH